MTDTRAAGAFGTGRREGRRMGGTYSPRVLDEPSHLLRRDSTGCDDEVALVLPSFIVHDDDELPAPERFYGILYGVEREGFAKGDVRHFLGT